MTVCKNNLFFNNSYLTALSSTLMIIKCWLFNSIIPSTWNFIYKLAFCKEPASIFKNYSWILYNCIIIHSCLYSFWESNCPNWACSFGCLFETLFFWHVALWVFEHFFVFWYKMFTLCFPAPDLDRLLSPTSPVSILVGSGVYKPRSGHGHCVHIVTRMWFQALSVYRARKYTCILYIISSFCYLQLKSSSTTVFLYPPPFHICVILLL